VSVRKAITGITTAVNNSDLTRQTAYQWLFATECIITWTKTSQITSAVTSYTNHTTVI